MIPPIKYSDIYLYSTSNDESTEFQLYLDSNKIKYTQLFYDLEHKNDSLDALSTWFLDPETEGTTIKFTKLPILILVGLLWLFNIIEKNKIEKLILKVIILYHFYLIFQIIFLKCLPNHFLFLLFYFLQALIC